jgi:hypothetical protein
MPVSWKREYIDSDPSFEFVRPGSRPTLPKEGSQMTIIYECLKKLGSASLTRLVKCCEANGYRGTFRAKDTDIKKSILYHLKSMERGDPPMNRQVIRELSR